MKILGLAIVVLFIGIHSADAMPLSTPMGLQLERETESNLKQQKRKLSQQQAMKQANELEAVLIAKMIEPLFPDGKDSMLFGGGNGSDIYRHLMIDEYAKVVQTGGGLGIAQNIAKDLSQ